MSDSPVRVQCVAGCGWFGARRLAMVTARPCPWCDSDVEAWQEPPLVFRAARAVEAVRERFLCPPSAPQPQERDYVEPIRGFTHRIWIVSERRYEFHTIPLHCRKGAKRSRRRR